MRIQPASRRTAFTLVEMLVASALIIFMMYIIASAFEKGLESFRVLRVQGELQDKLRAASSILRLDLTAPHFDDSTNTPNQNDFLSAQRLNDQMWQPPVRGYFRLSQPGTPAVGAGWLPEGVDPDNTNTVYFGMDTVGYKDLYLQFTVNMSNGHPGSRGARGRRDQFAQTDTYGGNGAVGPAIDGALNSWSSPDYNVNDQSAHPTLGYSTLFTSYWTEVTYFLKPQTDSAGNVQRAGGPNGPPLLNLYRRQALLVDGAPLTANMVVQNPPNVWNASEVSMAPYNYPPNAVPSAAQSPQRYNRPSDVTEPWRRWGMAGVFGIPYFQSTPGFDNALNRFPTYLDDAHSVYAHPTLGPRIGGDLILTDLVNFEVKVYWEPVRYGAPNTSRFINPTPPSGSPIPQARALNDAVEPAATNNPDFPFDRLPPGLNPVLNPASPPAGTYPPRVFDTWSANTDVVPTQNGTLTYQYGPGDPNTGKWNDGHFMPPGGAPTQASQYAIPLRMRMRAIQIKMRIWDKKSSLTRQVTLIQDL